MTRSQLAAHRETHTRENSWWLNDARGIPLCRVCDVCERDARAQYRPAVLDGDHAAYADAVEGERIEPDDP